MQKYNKNKKSKYKFLFLMLLVIIAVFACFLKDEKIDTKEKEEQPLDEKYVQEGIAEVTENLETLFGSVDEDENIEIQQNIAPHIDETTGVKYITYEDFGAKSDESFDNYDVMKQAHAYANLYGYEVRATSKQYHIYKLEDIAPIKITTNTDWNNATFYIHDENINDLETRKYSIFQIASNESNITITDENILNQIILNTETKKIDQLSGYGNALCTVYNDNKIQYIRYGSNENNGVGQKELFCIDNEGNILNEIQWDYDNITKITITPIPDETLTIKNGNFITILPDTDYEQSSGYFNRNIQCIRSNTILEGITHTVNNTERIAGPYFGFIKISYAADVTLRDSELYSHKYKAKSSYDLILECAVNVNIENVISNDIEKTNRWGITGSNYIKDVTYNNCILNRVDAHCGVNNLTIKDCIIGTKGISVIGSGNLNIINTVRLSSNSFIELRSDYGSTWDGTIYIKDCIYQSDDIQQLISFKTSYDGDELHYFGYDLYLPNIEIDGLDIIEGTLKNNNIYIFNNTPEKTGTVNGDMRNNYNLPQNIIIKNYEINDNRKLELFSNKFYSDLEELNINLSIPLKDKEKVKITNEEDKIIDTDFVLTNQTIKLTEINKEGIDTIININGQEVLENVYLIQDDGTYKVNIQYQNSQGEKEENNIEIQIDKTCPVISGVEDGKTYKMSVTPKVQDKNLQEAKIFYMEEEIEGYNWNTQLSQEGFYKIIAKDKVGNETIVNFQIAEPTQEDYKVKENMIANISSSTVKSEFDGKLTFSEKYSIFSNGEMVSDGTIIKTGDILKTESGDEYVLIVTGDINKDGLVNIKDVVKLRKYLLLGNNLDNIEIIAADTNLDSKEINIKDLVRMRIIVLTT